MLSNRILFNAISVALLTIFIPGGIAAQEEVPFGVVGDGSFHETIEKFLEGQGSRHPVIGVHKVVLDPEAIKTPADFEKVRQELFTAVKPMVREMHAYARARIAEIGGKNFKLKEADKDKTHRDFLNGRYRGEITFIDGYPCVRIVHHETGISLIFVDDGKVGEIDTSEHLQIVIDRQHIKANRHETVGHTDGRDAAVVRVKNWRDPNFVSYTYHPRPFPYTPEWWRAWSNANINLKVSKWKVAFGVGCGVAQFGLACTAVGARMGLQYLAGKEVQDFTFAPAVASMIWGVTIGIWNSTYRNIMNDEGTQQDKNIKSALQNFLFSYSLIFFDPVQGGWQVFDFSQSAAYMTAAYFAITAAIHGTARRAYYLFPEIRCAERDSSDCLKFKIRGQDVETDVPASSLEQQGIYLIPYFLKMLGYYPMGVLEVYLPGMTKPVMDLGTWILAASVPVVQGAAVSYAYSKDYRRAESLAADLKAKNKNLLKRVLRMPLSFLEHVYRLGHWASAGAQTCYYALQTAAGIDTNPHLRSQD